MQLPTNVVSVGLTQCIFGLLGATKLVLRPTCF